MKLLLLLVAGCLLTITISAQTLVGSITDVKGNAIPNATFYIHETTQGIMANESGEFQAHLKKGDYTCEISSLGFEKKKMTISVPEEGLKLTVRLEEKTYMLREVVVTPGKEDPAYRIMRKVIANAPFHLHQVKKYESDVYLKGNFKVDKIPALLKRQIKEKEALDMIGRLFVYESQSKIKYNEPDKYELHVVAITNTIPKDMEIGDNVPLAVVTNNIYSPTAFGGLLGPGSFSVYKFQFEEAYKEGDLLINKIRIIPRKKNGQLVDGWLYIVNDSWNVQQANLNMSQFGVSLNFNVTYNEVKPGAFLPTAYDVEAKISIVGVKGGGRFYSSIKYNDLETNNNYTIAQTAILPQPNTREAPKAQTKKQQKDLQKLEELASKDNLTTREAYKMANLAKKTVEPDEMKEQRRNLDVTRIDTKIIVTRDSLAYKRDSSFWNNTRTIPLQTEELKSYVQRDNISTVSDSLKSADSIQNRTFGNRIGKLLFGETINMNKKYYFRYSGLLMACTEYNFIDGFRIGQRIELGRHFGNDKNRSVSITPAVFYTTARKDIDFKIDGTLNYATIRGGRLFLSGGNTIADHADRNGTGRFGNTLGSILFAGNTAKFYQKRYAMISNKIEIANGLNLTAGFNFERRNDLDNNTSFNIFNKTPNSNRPHGQTDIMPDHDAFVADISVEYTPRYYYNRWNGRKNYIKSDYPTMRLGYKKGFGGNSGINSSFDNIEATILQNIKLGLFNSLFYEVNAGTFLSSKKTYLPDYKHFKTDEMFLSGKVFNSSFLMDNYIYATNDKWFQGHLMYSSNYLLIKQIPFLQSMLFDEAIHLHTLWTPEKNYNEVGYSIGFGDAIRLGVFLGFDKLKHERTGILISLPLMNTMNK